MLTNIAAHVPAMARSRPQTLAIVEPVGIDSFGDFRYRHLTFAELDADSDRLARGFAASGIGRGTRTVLMVPPSLDFYSLTFALFKLGAVVVLIDPGMGVRNLGVCLGEAQPEAFVGVPKAHVARLLLGWGKGTLRQWITVGRKLGWGGMTLDEIRHIGENFSGPQLADTHLNDLAAILFTSGSTGPAKGVMYTHGIFATQVEMLRSLYGIEPGEVDLPTFPLFGLFGPALGMTGILPVMDPTRPAQVDPMNILRAVRQFGVTNLFGSPALIRRVGQNGSAMSMKMPTLRRVISAGAPVSARAIARFVPLLAPGVQVHTPYGATEALPVASIGSDEILGETATKTEQGEGVCVGRPVNRMGIRIISITDDPIPIWSNNLEVPRGTIGEIVVEGPVVTQAYFNRPASTDLHKIDDPTRGVRMHRMGDVGYLDDKGRLWFCGRKSQRVSTPSGPLFTIPCEGIFNAHPAVYRTALVGVERSNGVFPVLCVERESRGMASITEAQLHRELLDLGARNPLTRQIQTILFHPSFPVDIRHNAKIFREKLAIWAARKLARGGLP